MYIKNRIVSLIYRLIFVFISGLGLFKNLFASGTFNGFALNYYTILSNLVCFIFFVYLVVINMKDINNKEVSKPPRIKGAVTMMITVTFLIYHFLLLPSAFDMGLTSKDILSLTNLIVHYIVPIMVILDWLLFDKKNTYKKIDPLIWIILPYIYFGYTIICAYTFKFNFGGSMYPYFFIDINKLGLGSVLLNVLALTIFFVILGYIIYFIDSKMVRKQSLKNNK